MGTRVLIQGARLSYPHLFQPRAIQAGDTPKYGTAVLIPKGNPAIAVLQQAATLEMGNKWGATPPPTAKGLPLYDGDTDPKYNTVAANHGHMILNTSAVDQPTLVDASLQPVINPATFYAGCVVNVDVGVFVYDQQLSKGAAAGLNGVQFVQDGERLDSRPSAEDMFGAVTGAPPPIAAGIAGAPPPAVAPAGVAPAPANGTPQHPGVPPAGVPDFLG